MTRTIWIRLAVVGAFMLIIGVLVGSLVSQSRRTEAAKALTPHLRQSLTCKETGALDKEGKRTVACTKSSGQRPPWTAVRE